VDRGEELEAVPPNEDRQLLAVLLRRGEPRVFQAVTIAVKPVRGDLALEPVGGNGRRVIQGLP
jgi:hypothetical protein